MERFGVRLREERNQQGLTLEQVEEETKIRKLYLKALEEESFDVLPPEVYARGFVKRYARFLKLDPDEMVREFVSLAYTKEPQEAVPDKQPNKPSKVERKPLPVQVKTLAVAAIFLFVSIWLGSLVVGYISNQNVADPTPVVPSQKQPVGENPSTTQGTQTHPQISEGLSLEIKAVEKCWLNVVVDGEMEYMDVLSPGQKKVFEGKERIYIKAGNAGGIELKLNDQVQPALGAISEVKEKEFLVEQNSKK